MALFKFIIFRLNFRYILPCRTVPNYAFCLNNAVQVEEFQLWFAQTDMVKAPYCNGGLLSEVESLALASKVKSLALASRPQVLENWPVLSSRTALFFELLNFFFGDRLKNFCEDFFFGEHKRLCPWSWPRAFLSLASRESVLGKAVLGLGLGFFLCPWPWPRALCPRLHLWLL